MLCFCSDCGIPVVENGKVDYPSGTLLDQSLTVTCNSGYDISGTATWTCADSGWDANATCVIQGNGFNSTTNLQVIVN